MQNNKQQDQIINISRTQLNLEKVTTMQIKTLVTHGVHKTDLLLYRRCMRIP